MRNCTRLMTLIWVMAAVAATMVFTASAQAGNDIIRVEEDWRLEIGEPEAIRTAPQIFTVISPYGNINDIHCIIELNHRTQPSYQAGGIQLQTWDGSSLLDYRNNPLSNKLSTTNEVITFTVVMSIESGTLRYEIVNGNSTTWGTFGGQGYLRTWIATAPNDLNAYDPNLSISQSKVGYAAHRVKLLARDGYRKYSAVGLESQSNTQSVVHQHTTSE